MKVLLCLFVASFPLHAQRPQMAEDVFKNFVDWTALLEPLVDHAMNDVAANHKIEARFGTAGRPLEFERVASQKLKRAL